MLNVTSRLNQTAHPYTRNGVEIEVLVNGNWLEIGDVSKFTQVYCNESYSGDRIFFGD